MPARFVSTRAAQRSLPRKAARVCGASPWASRRFQRRRLEKYDAPWLWWAFSLYGKTDVRIMDGEYAAWKAAGYETDMPLGGGSRRSAGNLTARERSGWVARMEEAPELDGVPTGGRRKAADFAGGTLGRRSQRQVPSSV